MAEIESIYTKLRNDIVAGNYVVNNATQYIYKATKLDADIINKGVSKGKENVSAIMCNNCKRRKASHDYNGTQNYKCDRCYHNSMNLDIYRL